MRWFRNQSGRLYESEVHLGILAIIVILLLINLLSSWSLQRIRLMAESDAQTAIREICLVLSRQLEPEVAITKVPTNWQVEIPLRVEAAMLTYLPVFEKGNQNPNQYERVAERLSKVIRKEDSGKLVASLSSATPGEFTHLNGNRFLYLSTMSRLPQAGMMIVVAEIPTLGELTASSKQMLVSSIVGLLLILVIYILLMRRITKPIRELTSQAEQAGRTLDESLDPATAVVRDYQRLIAELKDREQKLIEANASLSEEAHRLSQIQAYALRSMSRGMCVFGENDRVIAINPAAVVLFESASIPIEIGTPTEQFNAIVPNWNEIIQQLRISPVAVRLTTRLTTNSGVRVVEVIATEVLDHDQRPIGVGILLSDLTDEIAAAEDRARKERLSSLGEMAAGLAHQLRNSLGAIRGFASLVKRRVAPENQSHVDQLLAEGREAEELITRFLILSRPLELQVVSITLESLLRDVISGFEVRAREQGIDLVCDTGSDTKLEADPLLLKQAVGNLIDNALQHTPQGGMIQLELNPSTIESRVDIKIVDSGSGIPAEILPKLFTPFYSTRPSGTGLGLAFVRKVIEMHAGEIQIESQLGEGTTVTIALPMTRPFTTKVAPHSDIPLLATH